MNPVLLHYLNGSATADWIRACREIEADCDFAPDTAPVPQPAPMQEAA